MSRQRIGDVAEFLLDCVEQNQTFRAVNIMTVPTVSYTDPERWRAEVDLLKRLPLMLALTCEMPSPGDYKALEAVGLPVLIARDLAGKVRAFLNVCAHRGALVAAEGHGNCSRFICAYHGWSYDCDGRLKGIAQRAKFGDLDLSRRGLTQLPCEERPGLIFVCLTPGAALDVDDYYGAALEDYAAAGIEDWAFMGSRVIEGPNWKIAFDNFIESYHFATTHPKTVALELVPHTGHYEAFGPHMRVGYPYRSIGKLREVPRGQRAERENENFGFLRAFFPNLIGFLSPEFSLFNQIFPGPTPDRNRTIILFARKDLLKDAADLEGMEKKISSDIGIARDEDYAMGFRVQKGLESMAHVDVVFGENEPGNQYFHQWLDWYLHGDPTAAKPVLRD